MYFAGLTSSIWVSISPFLFLTSMIKSGKYLCRFLSTGEKVWNSHLFGCPTNHIWILIKDSHHIYAPTGICKQFLLDHQDILKDSLVDTFHGTPYIEYVGGTMTVDESGMQPQSTQSDTTKPGFSDGLQDFSSDLLSDNSFDVLEGIDEFGIGQNEYFGSRAKGRSRNLYQYESDLVYPIDLTEESETNRQSSYIRFQVFKRKKSACHSEL